MPVTVVTVYTDAVCPAVGCVASVPLLVVLDSPVELVVPSTENDVVPLATNVVADCPLSDIVCSDPDCVVSILLGLGVVPVASVVACPVLPDVVDVPDCDDGVVDS